MDVTSPIRTCIALALIGLPLSLSAQQTPESNCSGSACSTTTAQAAPTDGEQAVAIVNEFLARHKEFVPCQQNANAMTAYLEAHNLNPLRESSFEKAFVTLRRQGQLKIASR